MKYMDLKEFVEKGLLQEVNRQFFHPLGLAICFTKSDDDKYTIDSVMDCRDDPEGFMFKQEDLSVDKFYYVRDLYETKAAVRKRLFGTNSSIQPLLSLRKVNGSTKIRE